MSTDRQSWVLGDGDVTDPNTGETSWSVVTMMEHGLLWAINTYLAHPRGYQVLAHYADEEYTDFLGLKVVSNDGLPVVYPDDSESASLMGMLFAEMFPSPPESHRKGTGS